MKAIREVYQSPLRNMFGEEVQQRETWGDVRVGGLGPDANLLKANLTYFAAPWTEEGTICVVPQSQVGSVDPETPLIRLEERINDFAFHPFNHEMLLAASNDGSAYLFEIPEGGLTADMDETKAKLTLQPSEKRMMFASFHPYVDNLAMTHTADKTTRLWDVTSGQEKVSLPQVFKGFISSQCWSKAGDLLATTSKDKKLRLFDPRDSKLVAEVDDHPGAKGSQCIWLGFHDKIFTTGFSRGMGMARQYRVYDPRNLTAGSIIDTVTLDQASASLYPFFDEDLSLLYLAGKGEGSIKFLEIAADNEIVHLLNEYKSNKPQTGIAQLPKKSANTKKVEIGRLLKLTTSTITPSVIPIRIKVPRPENIFHDDLYPPTWNLQPSTDVESWFSGEDGHRTCEPIQSE